MWDKPKPAQLSLRWGLTHQLFLTNSHHIGMIPQLRPRAKMVKRRPQAIPTSQHRSKILRSEVLNILKWRGSDELWDTLAINYKQIYNIIYIYICIYIYVELDGMALSISSALIVKYRFHDVASPQTKSYRWRGQLEASASSMASATSRAELGSGPFGWQIKIPSGYLT